MPNQILLTNPVRPTWKWDFTTGKAPGGSTYTGSGGTYFNSSGVLTSATTNVPRFDYDPATLSPLGYLAEMASTNLLLRSDALDNASWSLTRATVSANATTSPDGTANADKLVEDATASSTHRIFSNTIALTNSGVSASIFAKAGERTAFRIEFAGGAGTFGSSFNLSTVAAVSVDANTTATIRAVGNGWYRCSVQATWPSATNCNVFIYLQAVAGTTSYSGDGTSGMYFWGGQCELGGVGTTSYIPTAGATASRTQDVLSLPLTSLPGWSATQGGVLVAAYRLHTVRPSNSQAPATITDVAGQNDITMIAQYGGAGSSRVYMYSGNVSQFAITGAVFPAVFTRRKQALGWGTSRGVHAHDGTIDGTASGSYTLPVSPTSLIFGYDEGGAGSSGLNGTLESIAYYRGARSDAFVQAVSR